MPAAQLFCDFAMLPRKFTRISGCPAPNFSDLWATWQQSKAGVLLFGEAGSWQQAAGRGPAAEDRPARVLDDREGAIRGRLPDVLPSTRAFNSLTTLRLSIANICRHPAENSNLSGHMSKRLWATSGLSRNISVGFTGKLKRRTHYTESTQETSSARQTRRS